MVKAIETAYNGYRFRSRLEARWAVFFDAINLRYQYEPEGFVIPAGDAEFQYLPDFYLPDFDMHVEVKGDYRRLNMPRLMHVVNALDQLLLLGDLPNPVSWTPKHSLFYAIDSKSFRGRPAETYIIQSRSVFTQHALNWDGEAGDEWSRAGKLLIPEDAWPQRLRTALDHVAWSGQPSPVAEQYKKARSARFEFGETPGRTTA
jgi:hypothetical protein